MASHIYGVSHVSELHPNLYLTSIYGATKDNIVKRNITLLINAAQELPKLELSGVESIKLFLDDTPHAVVHIYFDRISDRIHEHLNKGGRVLVHCVLGVSRSTSLCCAYLMKYKNMTLKQAFDHIAQRRPIARPNPGFWRQLLDYEKRLFNTKSLSTTSTISSHTSGTSTGTNSTNSSSKSSSHNNHTTTTIPITIISTSSNKYHHQKPSSSSLYLNTSIREPATTASTNHNTTSNSSWLLSSTTANNTNANNNKTDTSKLYKTDRHSATSASRHKPIQHHYTSNYYDREDAYATPIVSSLSVQPSYNTHRTNLLVNDTHKPTFATTYRSSYSRF